MTGTPPLLPIKVFIEFDTVIEPEQERMTLRALGLYTDLVELDSLHQTTKLMNFVDG